MNFELIGNLVRLRYKLLWAKTRSRNGRIALFMAGYLLLVMLIALLASGGFGAALVAGVLAAVLALPAVSLAAPTLIPVPAINRVAPGTLAMASITR